MYVSDLTTGGLNNKFPFKSVTFCLLFLIITDGKPNDLDIYDSRYGIEDTRMAVHEARRMGLTPFCVTIDREAGSYLPYLFGPAGFCVIRKPEELPRRLPLLYVQLTRQ